MYIIQIKLAVGWVHIISRQEIVEVALEDAVKSTWKNKCPVVQSSSARFPESDPGLTTTANNMINIS